MTELTQAKEKKGILPTIGSYGYDEFIEMVKSFHGHVAPGMVIGGFMVDMALNNLPEGELFDAVCETGSCLPDAIQLLTPCTVGNGWMRIFDVGRYALTLFEKFGGEGVRVHVDPIKLENWPEVYSWFFKLKPKKEQDFELLMAQIRDAGAEYCSNTQVRISQELLPAKGRGGFAICPVCRESFPLKHGGICLGCRGELPYSGNTADIFSREPGQPGLNPVKVEDAVGKHALHDMTRIIPGREKGPKFKRDQRLGAADVCRLQKMGRENIYTVEDNTGVDGMIHEDVAAAAFGAVMSGNNVSYTEKASEGKVSFVARNGGLLEMDEQKLERFNHMPGVICACRHRYSVVAKGEKIGATRAIPLYLPEHDFKKALAILGNRPLFQILPMRRARVGILITGTEVFRGLVQDKFKPVIKSKVEKFDCEVVDDLIVPDDADAICSGVHRLLDAGADLIVTTAGLSVDPDDLTRKGLVDAGVRDMIYGVPVLPGAMTLLAGIKGAQVIGVPACGLYHKITSFDLLLPRLLAGVPITRRDLAKLGLGGYCLSCNTCTFPKCTFGKQ